MSYKNDVSIFSRRIYRLLSLHFKWFTHQVSLSCLNFYMLDYNTERMIGLYRATLSFSISDVLKEVTIFFQVSQSLVPKNEAYIYKIWGNFIVPLIFRNYNFYKLYNFSATFVVFLDPWPVIGMKHTFYTFQIAHKMLIKRTTSAFLPQRPLKPAK